MCRENEWASLTFFIRRTQLVFIVIVSSNNMTFFTPVDETAKYMREFLTQSFVQVFDCPSVVADQLISDEIEVPKCLPAKVAFIWGLQTLIHFAQYLHR